MGKPKGSKKRSYLPREPKEDSPTLNNNATTPETMIEKINGYLESCDFNLAEKFANRAVERFPDNENVLEAAAECYTEIGQVQKARSCYQKGISKHPLTCWRMYLGYAQLLESHDAALQYTKGIEVIERSIAAKMDAEKAAKMEVEKASKTDVDGSNKPTHSTESVGSTEGPSRDPPVDEEPTFRDLSSAYIALSELYTTDLCDEPNAEDMCKYALEKAMLADPKNPEVFQQLGNFYLIKDEKEMAKQYVKGGLCLWFKDESGNTAVDTKEKENVPIAFQVECARSLIECEEYELADKLLTDILKQSPNDPELWYLRGFSNFLHGKDHYRSARSDLKKAVEFSTTPFGVCYDIINQCNEHLKTISESVPDADAADSDDEAEETANVPQPVQGDNAEGHDSDWETDEEEVKDVEMGDG